MKFNCIFIAIPFVKTPFHVYFYQAKRNTPANIGKIIILFFDRFIC